MTTKIKPTVLGDILKSEADFNSRIAISANPATKIGQLVQHPVRGGEYLVALSNAEHGKVLVQPHNCVVSLGCIKVSDIKAVTTLDDLKNQGDKHGIKYIGEPINDVIPEPNTSETTELR